MSKIVGNLWKVAKDFQLLLVLAMIPGMHQMLWWSEKVNLRQQKFEFWQDRRTGQELTVLLSITCSPDGSQLVTKRWSTGDRNCSWFLEQLVHYWWPTGVLENRSPFIAKTFLIAGRIIFIFFSRILTGSKNRAGARCSPVNNLFTRWWSMGDLNMTNWWSTLSMVSRSIGALLVTYWCTTKKDHHSSPTASFSQGQLFSTPVKKVQYMVITWWTFVHQIVIKNFWFCSPFF